MKSYERIDADGFESQVYRYRKIDTLNQRSFLMTEGSSLQVIQSLHSIGTSRETAMVEIPGGTDFSVPETVKKLARKVLAGNMSPLNGYGPHYMSVEERIQDAKNNLNEFLYLNDIDPADVRLLRPERNYDTPLSVVDLSHELLSLDDTGLLRPDKEADMMFTYNPGIIMAARPADCPIVFATAETSKGEVSVLLHLATLGVAHGYIAQSKQVLEGLGVDWETARIQITPGGHEETYRFENFTKYDPREKFPDTKSLYGKVEESKTSSGEKAFSYGIDIAAEVYEKVVETWGIDPYQVFLDTTDTTSPTVGYSSNARSFKGYMVGDNTRDVVLARHINNTSE